MSASDPRSRCASTHARSYQGWEPWLRTIAAAGFALATQKLDGITGRGTAIRLEPWGKDDLPLLQRLLGDPAMMEHVGGPETQRGIERRHRRYAKPGSHQFKIVDEATGEGVGWVGYWERDWRGEKVYETGWFVLPEFQGRGIAGAATLALIARARAEGDRRYLHAYPSVDNAPSNAICRKAGFTLLGVVDLEYPPGSVMRCNDWFVDLRAGYD